MLDQSTRCCINSCLLTRHLIGQWADWCVDIDGPGGTVATGVIVNHESAPA